MQTLTSTKQVQIIKNYVSYYGQELDKLLIEEMSKDSVKFKVTMTKKLYKKVGTTRNTQNRPTKKIKIRVSLLVLFTHNLNMSRTISVIGIWVETLGGATSGYITPPIKNFSQVYQSGVTNYQ